MNHPNNPFKDLVLDKEEQDISHAVERGEFVSVPQKKSKIKRYEQYARKTMDKVKNINIRVSELTLFKLKAKAMEEGIPYQTLMGSIIHKYVSA